MWLIQVKTFWGWQTVATRKFRSDAQKLYLQRLRLHPAGVRLERA